MKKIYLLAIILFVTSCAPTAFERLLAREGELRSARQYDSYLALEYLEFSRNLRDAKEKKQSKYFANKGLNVADDKSVIPEDPQNWDADPKQLEELVLMQKRLELVLHTPRMKFFLPIQLSHLSFLYDCWVVRESKPVFRVSDLAKCKSRFYKLLEEIEFYIEESRRDSLPKVMIVEPEFSSYEIYFDYNSYKLNNRATLKLKSALRHIKSLEKKYKILVVGNTDRSGKKLYNQGLAIKRAEIVKDHLVKSGIMEDFVELKSIGESFPDILTADHLKKKQNRRVGVYIMEGVGDFSTYPLPLIKNYIYKKEIEAARKKRGIK